MPNLFLTPVGTSSITNYVFGGPGGEFIKYFKEHIEGGSISNLASLKGLEEFKEEIVEYIGRNYWSELAKPVHERRLLLSAEMTSLEMLKKNKVCDETRDAVALFYSDTADGYLAAGINVKVLSDVTGVKRIKLYKLSGVSAHDVKSFSEAVNGQSLRAVIDNARADFADFEPTVVFTGGFKGLIPLLTLYALESKSQKMDMYYLYERSNQMVWYHFKDSQDASGKVLVSPLDIF